MFYSRVISTVFWNAFYSLGLGPLPWFITAELFSHSSRSVTVCLTVVVHWFANFVMSLCLLILKVNYLQQIYKHNLKFYF